MLVSNKDIHSINPPFLILFADGSWKVAAHIFPHAEGLCYVQPFYDSDEADNKVGLLVGAPFHVADNVWEMEYSVQIMTLAGDYYHDHPAWAFWQEWVQHKVANKSDQQRAAELAQAKGATV